MEIVAKYLCVIPCEDQDWEREYVRDMENGCIMCDYRMEDEQ